MATKKNVLINRFSWVMLGMIGSISVGLASVPSFRETAGSLAIDQSMREIRAAKERDLRGDVGIERLKQAEAQHRERLPSLGAHPQVVRPMQRVMGQRR